jgi:hypothetical protein
MTKFGDRTKTFYPIWLNARFSKIQYGLARIQGSGLYPLIVEVAISPPGNAICC